MDFYNELTVAVTGMDDAATAAWFKALLANTDDRRAANVHRAAAHWQLASESQKDAIAHKLGWTDGPATAERWPVPQAIAADYRAALAFAESWLA